MVIRMTQTQNEAAFRTGFIALIGKPNVGKSTLLNRLIGQHISITADKPQTTRNRIRGILNGGRYQAVLLDTPGIHRPRNELHRRIVRYAVQSLGEADLVLLLTEALDTRDEQLRDDDRLVLEYLEAAQQKAILVINKIDRARADQVLKTISVWNDRFRFVETVPISALKGKGLQVLTRVFLSYLPTGAPYFPIDQLTDTPERVVVAELVREQIMRLCFQEVPYTAAVLVDAFKETPERISIYATIFVEKNSHKKIVIGKNGDMLKKVGTNARIKIEKLLGIRIFLSLHVKQAGNWINNPRRLGEFGYHET
jgi:GTPase